MNKKEKRAALKSALTSRVVDSKIVVLDEIKFNEIKTKNFANVMKNLKLDKALMVIGDNDANVILKYDTLVVTKDAVAKIE